MKKTFLYRFGKKIKMYLALIGVNLFTFYVFLKGLIPFLLDYIKFRKQLKVSNNKDFNRISLYPILTDRYEESGSASGHYFHQDLLIAKRVFINQPDKHVDLGSRVDGFVAHVAVFKEVEVIDIRKQESKVENIKFIQADLMNFDDNLIDYCDSFSSLHAIEHFGLGRYGDPIDANGHVKALENIHKILKNNGIFYFSTPIGEQRLEFNAHRVFNIKYLLDFFENKFIVEKFSYVDDNGNLFENIELNENSVLNNFGCWWGCGIFELRKV